MALKIVRRYDANGRELTEKDLETFRLDSPVVREILANLNREVAEGIRQREKKMTIEDVIKKSILPLAFMVFWFWMTKTIMKVSGQTDWFWWVFIAGLPFGIHKMRLILIPRGMDTTATLGMAALSVIIGALIGSIMIPVYVIRAIYVFIRYVIGK
ncbi:MAG: DUF6050 family protein [Lachnospira sp.]